MTSRKEWVMAGVYDNKETNRREKYDKHGNVIESTGIEWIKNNKAHKFGYFPDVPSKPPIDDAW